MNFDWIKNGAMCVDKRGKKYTIITRARDIQTGEYIVVYKQEFGDMEILCCPMDAFLISFEPLDGEDEVISISAVKKPVTVEEKTMMFFDTEDFDEKGKILKELQLLGAINNNVIDNFAATLDFVISEGDLDKRCDELSACLKMRAKYENTRLRKQA